MSYHDYDVICQWNGCPSCRVHPDRMGVSKVDTPNENSNDLIKPIGKVIILKNNERVISKWSYYIFQILIALGVFQGLLRLAAWVAS